MIMGKSFTLCLKSDKMYLCVTVAGLIKYLVGGEDLSSV